MTDRQLMQQALEALERCVATCFHAYAHEQVMSRPEHFVNQNITALRKRLAQPEQEPVATVYDAYDTTGIDWHCKDAPSTGTKLYTTPPRREWVGLTLEEIGLLTTGDGWAHLETPALALFARAIEAKLREKNNG